VKASHSSSWLLATSLLLLTTAESSARNRWVVFPADAESAPAVRYADLGPQPCLSELRARGIPFTPAAPRKTIDAPVMLDCRLHDVQFEFSHGAEHKQVLDCRLLLALDDLAAIATARGVGVVRYNSIFRRGWARGRVQGHLGGVAIDITELVKRDGTVLNVHKDFAGERIGSATCGSRAAEPKPGKAAELRGFVCALDQARIFNLLLTPHYDHRHRDHFHFEVRRGVRWFLTQ
jgi:hypothetical protein